MNGTTISHFIILRLQIETSLFYTSSKLSSNIFCNLRTIFEESTLLCSWFKFEGFSVARLFWANFPSQGWNSVRKFSSRGRNWLSEPETIKWEFCRFPIFFCFQISFAIMSPFQLVVLEQKEMINCETIRKMCEAIPSTSASDKSDVIKLHLIDSSILKLVSLIRIVNFPGSKIPLILQDRRRILTRRSCKKLTR